MKKLKLLTKKIIIYIVLFMIIISSISSPVFSYTAQEIESAVAGYSKNYVEQGNAQGIIRYCLAHGYYVYSHWDPENANSNMPSYNNTNHKESTAGLHYFCCATFVSAMYWKVTGGALSPLTDSVLGIRNWGNAGNATIVSLNAVEPGDILTIRNEAENTGHTAIYIGDNKIAHASGEGGDEVTRATDKMVVISEYNASDWQQAHRITESAASKVTTLDTTYSIAGTGNFSSSNDLGPSKFFFNGIPDGRYSLASKMNIFEWIVNALKALLNYLIGLITYLIRGLIIAFVSIFDREINHTVESITTSTPKTLQEFGVSATSADDPDSINRYVTIQGLVFNEIDLFDVNIFKK